MDKVCILSSTLFFILFIVFLAISLYVFNLSLSMILKHRTAPYINIVGFLMDSAVSVTYLLFASILLLLAGVMLYGATVSALRCSDT
jgi:hypothetical protein